MVKTLHARTATSEKDFEEYEEESEPNMKSVASRFLDVQAVRKRS